MEIEPLSMDTGSHSQEVGDGGVPPFRMRTAESLGILQLAIIL